ncbi:MAG TPA: ATP-dependent zinc metalloprotease FtsH [Candidatus Merdivicinus excrementipullorum]|uniref:ATP-dependent zinc metalloprotease FtsH n=1 Tax=Candidatus Merdivicinus excrementipullorum TaxID=2840867 RepID=A0A9D1FKU4_9FIRM|nr:ATP-dependent zinc metalloprotease FtsH [Candidatus Merdivicinus excrementipullorum]
MSTMFMRMMTPTVRTYTYSDILYMFEDQKVSEFSLDVGSGELAMKTTDGRTVSYRLPSVSLFLDQVDADIQEYNEQHPDARMQYNLIPASDNSWLLSLIPYVLMIAVMGLLWYFMFKQASGGGKMNQFGKANMKNPVQMGKKTTFAEVAGADEEKEELAEIVEFLKNPKKFNELGARIPKGVLLVGPPGTGKTLLARAVAGEAGVPFFSISGSDFVEMFVGVGASRVRDLFEQAKKNSPSIIFIDEIDAVGRHRGAGLGGGHDEREQTLNQLLVEMDGFGANEGVIVIAATNRRDILDPALLRPGRFDRQVIVNYPDVKGREEILKVHARNKPLGFDVDLSVVAKSTAGFTGADLENLMNEAALLAARKGRKAITEADIEEATIKVVAGPEKKSKVVSEKEKRLTAYHEGGHAVATFYSETQDPVHEVSIIPRGMAGGYTLSLPEHDRSYMSRKEMREEIVTLLGGRVAESLVLDDISTGASNDLERATKLAKSMVTRYGFSEKLGPVVYGQDEGEPFLGRDFNHIRDYSENVAAEIDSEVRDIIDTGYETVKELLTAHMDQLHLVAAYLMEHEKIDGATFDKLMKGELDYTPPSERQQELSADPMEALKTDENPFDNDEDKEAPSEE